MASVASFVSSNHRSIVAGLALAILALASSPALALSSGDIVSAGSVWLETTIAVAMVFVTSMAFSLQIARGYFTRVLNKFTLRLGADIWWLAYILIRDGLIFVSFVMGLMVFFPGTFLDYPMAVPFMPVAVVLFGVALVIKLYVDADENRNAFRAVTLLTFMGAALWVFGTVFVLESPLQLSTLPAGVSATSGIWAYTYNTFSSTTNLSLAMESFEACFAALGALAIAGLAHPVLHSRLPRMKRAVEQTIPSPAALPTTRAADPSRQSVSPADDQS